ncbi:MAG: hypothetical protein KAT27_07390 [Desulfobacterales bacterium]|nr:hypothetical protein [Desulfobacterales bacterium]
MNRYPCNVLDAAIPTESKATGTAYNDAVNQVSIILEELHDNISTTTKE